MEENNIMVIKLESPVTLSMSIRLIINNEKSSPTNGQDLTVLGLGLTIVNDDSSTPNFLRDMELQAINMDQSNTTLVM
jgi:hypothetical protein